MKTDDETLTSMKLPPREKSTKEVLYPAESGEREYPWGLQITLEEEQLKALGITALPATGATITLEAKGEICSTSAYDSADDGVRRSVSIQITDLGIGG